MNLTINEASAGLRADQLLAKHLGVSRARAKQQLQVATLNGAPVKASATLRLGDRLEWEELPEEIVVVPPVERELPPILYQDDDLLVINKPRGLVVHPGNGEAQITLVDVLRSHQIPLSSVGPSERAGIVHRLDKETSGLMIVCKTDAAHWKLAADFEARTIEKNYLALVCGVPHLPKGGKGRIEAPIARHRVQRQKMSVSPEGRHAVTQYSLLRQWTKFALCEVELLTGRTHQIRVHFQYLGHPIVGDGVYGGHKRGMELARDNETLGSALQVLGGQALHSWRLQFVHPISGATLRFEAPVPDDFSAVLNALGPDKSEAERD